MTHLHLFQCLSLELIHVGKTPNYCTCLLGKESSISEETERLVGLSLLCRRLKHCLTEHTKISGELASSVFMSF